MSGKKPALVFLTIAMLALCLVPAAGISAIGSIFDDPPHPSSTELIDRFQRNRSDFDLLVTMFRQDPLNRIAPDFTRPEDYRAAGVDDKRIASYRSLFQKLGIKAGIEGYKSKDRITFWASTRGLSIAGSAKGYLYSTYTPEELVDDIDNYHNPDGYAHPVSRRIEGSWYLVYDESS